MRSRALRVGGSSPGWWTETAHQAQRVCTDHKIVDQPDGLDSESGFQLPGGDDPPNVGKGHAVLVGRGVSVPAQKKACTQTTTQTHKKREKPQASILSPPRINRHGQRHARVVYRSACQLAQHDTQAGSRYTGRATCTRYGRYTDLDNRASHRQAPRRNPVHSVVRGGGGTRVSWCEVRVARRCPNCNAASACARREKGKGVARTSTCRHVVGADA